MTELKKFKKTDLKIKEGFYYDGLYHTGLYFNGDVYRGTDQWKLEDPCVIISWLPMNKKVKFVSKIRGQRNNRLYYNYGYLESEMCILNVLAEDTDGVKGRILADEWLTYLETYIKNNWNTLVNGIGVNLNSFTAHREVPEYFTERLYGLETRFEMQSHNIWTDEPLTGATDLTDISGISIVTSGEDGATGMINVWVN